MFRILSVDLPSTGEVGPFGKASARWNAGFGTVERVSFLRLAEQAKQTNQPMPLKKIYDQIQTHIAAQTPQLPSTFRGLGVEISLH